MTIDESTDVIPEDYDPVAEAGNYYPPPVWAYCSTATDFPWADPHRATWEQGDP